MAIDWEAREDVQALPAFAVAALARYEDGIRTELAAELDGDATYAEREAAQGYADAARTELVSLMDFLVGRLEPND